MVYYSRCVLLKNPQEWHNVPWSLGALCVRPVRTSQCARAPWLCLRRRHCLHEIDRVVTASHYGEILPDADRWQQLMEMCRCMQLVLPVPERAPRAGAVDFDLKHL